MARMARINTAISELSFYMMNLLKSERIISHFCETLAHVQVFRLQAIAIPLQATGGVNSTPHRAHLTRATRKFSPVHVAQDFHKSNSISSMFHRTLLDAQLSSPFSTPFPTRAPSPITSPSLLCPSATPSTATLQGPLP